MNKKCVVFKLAPNVGPEKVTLSLAVNRNGVNSERF